MTDFPFSSLNSYSKLHFRHRSTKACSNSGSGDKAEEHVDMAKKNIDIAQAIMKQGVGQYDHQSLTR